MKCTPVSQEQKSGELLRQISRFLCLLLFLFSVSPLSALAETGLITGFEALKRSQAGKLIIVDVRTPQEWRTSGMPVGSVGATYRSYGFNLLFQRSIKEITANNPDQPIALICATGVRSSNAARLLREKGYSQVYDIIGGMHGNRLDIGWIRRHYPLQKCSNC